MNNFKIALDIAIKEINEIQEELKIKCYSYRELIDNCYDGDSNQFKNDLYYCFNEYRNKNNTFEFTDNIEIINDKDIITYRKFINILKKEFFKK